MLAHADAQPRNTATSTFVPGRGIGLQRKCACGSHPSLLTGECAECKSKKQIQAKLTIGASNDPLEQEADRIADQVLAVPASTAVRGAGPCIQQFTGESTGEHASAPASADSVLDGSGSPLDPTLKQDMEQHFGHDFSRVRVHSGAAAEQSARDVNANAYTVGHNVVFGAGQYAPSTSEGRRLLAHELTHVLQQRGRASSSVVTTGGVGESHTIDEQRADAVAETVMLGQKVTVISRSDRGVRIQRQGFGELRVAEARIEEEGRIGTSPVDGEFWFLPPGVPTDSAPIFDDEDTQVIVGFHTRGSVTFVYDLEGTLVDISEPGLESPLIDPIDILVGGIFGLGRGLLRGGARGAARGIAGGAGRGGAGAALGAGLRATIGALSRSAVTAVCGVYRATRFRGVLNFTGTTAARMADPARRVPHHILKLAIRFGTRSADPQGAAGAFRYVIPMFRKGRQYTLEVVIREADNTVLHFLYR